MPGPRRNTRPVVEPITYVIANRVRVLRETQNISQDKLAEKMREIGSPWTRATVNNLERRSSASRASGGESGRNAVSAQELAHLAVVLGVPPAWLIADPTGEQPTPVADGVDLDGWSAILWFTGQQALRNQPDHRWAAASEPIRTVLQIQALAERVEGQIRLRETDPRYIAPEDAEPVDAKAAEQADRPLVERLVPQLKWLAEHGFSAPLLPEAVAKRARELGVALPGVGD